MAAKSRIAVEHLLDAYLKLPEELRSNSPGFMIALSVVKYFLGEDWLEKHLSPHQSAPGFMRLHPEFEQPIQSFKTIDLGELLFNLQHIPGFDNCVTRMKSEEHVESGLAELDFARMLFISGHKFKFVAPQGKRGNDYDFEIEYKRWTICADVKCKLDDKALSKSIILNELKNSRDQLPSDRPGIFFMKIPQHWTNKYLWEQLLTETAKEFMRSTRRIVSVKYFIAGYQVRGEQLAQAHGFGEIPNPNNRFDPREEWKLFTYRPSLGAADALPLIWRRFIDFPNRLLRTP